MVPVTGVEPVRYRYHWILSPARLPIPSHRHGKLLYYSVLRIKNQALSFPVFKKIASFHSAYRQHVGKDRILSKGGGVIEHQDIREPFPLHPCEQILFEIARVHQCDRFKVRGEERHKGMGIGVLQDQEVPAVFHAGRHLCDRMISTKKIGILIPALQKGRVVE